LLRQAGILHFQGTAAPGHGRNRRPLAV